MLQVPKLTHKFGISGGGDEVCSKPRLVFFKYQWAPGLPDFLLTHTREHVACLSQFFDVIVIDDDCDYQQVCDEYEPDLALFESGINISTCRRIKIANVQRHANVPKLGFFNADAWCETRSGILSEMDHWQIDTFFSIAVTAGEHTPAISKNLFVWPNGVDSNVYKDYTQPKVIPVLLTGATGSQYPWRRRVFELVSKQYPSMTCPHHGYTSRAGTGRVLQGEVYARTINASVFAPTCGTIAKEVVRKHFEIPACGACLITENSAGLEAAGFIDMQNCVFADERNVLDKIAFLFENVDTLTRITQAGHDLVHSRHTFEHRNQVLQWLRLHQSLKPGERIVQVSPFEPLCLASAESRVERSYLISNGLNLSLLSEGNKFLLSRESQKAERCFTKCLEFMTRFPEAKFGLALCKLQQGKPQAAQETLAELLQYTLAEYNASDPDPVEWAYYILASLCLGDVKAAVKRSNQFVNLTHPELARVRWVTCLLSEGKAVPFPDDDDRQHRASLHRLPHRSRERWIGELSVMLRTCGQTALAESVLSALRQAGGEMGKAQKASVFTAIGQKFCDAFGICTDGAIAFRARFLYAKARRRLAGVLGKRQRNLNKRRPENS